MIYEYVCEDCGHEWEVEQKISDPKIKECPSCKKDMAKRVISKSSFQLKGGGWFKDGY